MMTIRFWDEEKEVTNVEHYDGDLPRIECEDGTAYYVAETHEEAGKKARERWADMAKNDPKEFIAIVSEEVLVAWALGQYAGPG